MKPGNKNSYKTLQTINIDGIEYKYYSLREAEKNGLKNISKLPKSLKVLLENLLRFEDNLSVTKNQIDSIKNWIKEKKSNVEIAYRPTRVLLQDYTGIPAVADLAAMREAVKEKNKDPNTINPLSSVDLVIDHSVQVDKSAEPDSFKKNVDIEFERNSERYSFLKWGQQAFNNFRIVPPGTGICHQVNLEYLSKVVWVEKYKGDKYLFPDTLVGTDSHTTMVNGLSVLGWGVGGIEAEAGMLGQPISMLIPEVIGFEFTNKMPEGSTATDLVLTVVKMLRDKGVVGKFVEFYGDGLKNLTLADRATIANMAPEYGATCGFFPVDDNTLSYMRLSGRKEEDILGTEAYCKAQGLWYDSSAPEKSYTALLELDLSTVDPALAGPKRPQDRVDLSKMATHFEESLTHELGHHGHGLSKEDLSKSSIINGDYDLNHGDVVIAAITSCTNTSNPGVMLAAGILARNARKRGLMVKPWVKTSLAPGSRVVTEYYEANGLDEDLAALGFNNVGYGCTTCIGNSGPIPEDIEAAIDESGLIVGSVLSGNRNFEGRVHQKIKASYLASPPLVVAYALAGSLNVDLTTEPLGFDRKGDPVMLSDVWPSDEELQEAIAKITPEMFRERYATVMQEPRWDTIPSEASPLYPWQEDSTYIRLPTFFQGLSKEVSPIESIEGAKVLLKLGDSITTDHISPAGAFPTDGPAGKWLVERGVQRADFNSFGSRRGNHEIMMRGTFANVRVRNQMAPGTEGGYALNHKTGEISSVYEAAMDNDGPMVVLAGSQYGTGSSRDWAAKGTYLLGVKAVIATSFERIHRSNLVGMGVLPLTFKEGEDADSIGLDGTEFFDIPVTDDVKALQELTVTAHKSDGTSVEFKVDVRLDTPVEVDYYRNGGILHTVLRNLAQ